MLNVAQQRGGYSRAGTCRPFCIPLPQHSTQQHPPQGAQPTLSLAADDARVGVGLDLALGGGLVGALLRVVRQVAGQGDEEKGVRWLREGGLQHKQEDMRGSAATH